MEALVGVGGRGGGATLTSLGARNLKCFRPHLLSGFKSQQFFIGKSSSFMRLGPFASSEGARISRAQGIGGWRRGSFRILAKLGEETESTQDSAGTTDASKIVKGKGFGTPKRVVEKKKSSSSSPPASNIRRPLPEKPVLVAEVDEETKQFETGFVASLAFLFSLIIIEGIALAASGFLPDEWDEFLLKAIYPIFTPTVGVFFAGAAAYGVWKFSGLGEKKGPTSK